MHRNSARLRRALPAALAALAVLAPAGADAATTTRDVLVASNNWDGTATLVDESTLNPIKTLNVVPDKDARLAEIYLNPDRLTYFLLIRDQIGEGHDQLVDDGFIAKDGKTVFFSRPSFADVVAIDIKTNAIKWRQPVPGYRSDHMALSPDGTRLLVSASTANRVVAINTATGAVTGGFDAAEAPHENNFTRDGSRIFNASIGTVYSDTDDPALDFTKGERRFRVVDASTYQVVKTIDMGQKLAEAGYPNMSSAVRPMAISPDEQWLYFQVSFFHGFVEYDLATDKVTRLARLPLNEYSEGLPREQYVLDSAHHGLAMNSAGTKLCSAGTMSNYAAITPRSTLVPQSITMVGDKPYWALNSTNGKYCYISVAGLDRVAVIDWDTGQQVKTIPVGDHVQRLRVGKVLSTALS